MLRSSGGPLEKDCMQMGIMIKGFCNIADIHLFYLFFCPAYLDPSGRFEGWDAPNVVIAPFQKPVDSQYLNIDTQGHKRSNMCFIAV